VKNERHFSRPGKDFPIGEPRGPSTGARPVADTSWREGIPALAAEHRGSLADAEADAGYRFAAPAVAGRHVLDVGCGAGHGTELLLDAGAASAVGIDPDREAIELATRRCGERAGFACGEPAALPFSGPSFDAVVCLEALESATDPEALLDRLIGLLHPGGVLVASLPTRPLRDPIDGAALAERPGAEGWRERLSERLANVAVFRRRVTLGAAVLPAEAGEERIESVRWLGADPSEEQSALLVGSDAELPELAPAATLVGGRDLRAYRATIAAWEQRARRAEADGSAKHWELVASRESQRRLRKRLWQLEHRPLRILSRILRGQPARIGEGPPLRAPERRDTDW
jgi:SAM-dependent methyltransferase